MVIRLPLAPHAVNEAKFVVVPAVNLRVLPASIFILLKVFAPVILKLPV
jgi:hypothetical protein